MKKIELSSILIPMVLITAIIVLGGVLSVLESSEAKDYPQGMKTHEANVARMAECLESAHELCNDAFGRSLDRDMRDEKLAIAIELYRTGR